MDPVTPHGIVSQYIAQVTLAWHADKSLPVKNDSEA